ncbi:hypothetical protein QR680_015805 [Steinernema hermaphroditum]|uniref:Major facilitator superfamily (MFS) profile domain-containing protein n=1 Tax=Steinernema hermaphroditum TaxID=289476 RepID=A0AA39H908_9BILA|nr:hypothetical protein QR680_015805 [Steinernema hermaphroditum]
MDAAVAPRCGHYRLIIVFLLMFALFLIDSIKMNLGMAMVCMVNHTAFADHPTNLLRNNETLRCERNDDVSGAIEAGYTGHLLWSPSMQSLLLSAVFYGALITTLPSGYLADWFSSKTLLFSSLLLYTVTTLLSPILAEVSYTAFLLNRAIMGLGEGSTFPTVVSIASHWFPPADRSAMVAIYTGGTQVAGMFGGITSASLCSMELLGGWPLIFYVYGALGVIWLLVWLVFGSSKPSGNRWISDSERIYIMSALQYSKRDKAHKSVSRSAVGQLIKFQSFWGVPWLSILTSLPLWSVCFAWFANNFAVGIIQSILPSYFRDVLQLDLKSNGMFTILPFVMQLITKLSCGFIADYIRRRGYLGHTATCKLFQTVGCMGTVVTCTLLAMFIDCSTPYTALFLLSLQGLIYPAFVSGWATSLVAICPRYSRVVTSIGMPFALIGSASSPALFGLLSEYFPGSEYTLLLLAAAGINAAAGLFFLIFGSAKIQPWAEPKTSISTITPLHKNSSI